jgi:hypothetical protein
MIIHDRILHALLPETADDYRDFEPSEGADKVLQVFADDETREEFEMVIAIGPCARYEPLADGKLHAESCEKFSTKHPECAAHAIQRFMRMPYLNG